VNLLIKTLDSGHAAAGTYLAMPNRKLVKIGEDPKLPTIEEFFLDMAARQHDEIRKLKQEIAGHPLSGEPLVAPADPRKPVPDPWLLHPTRIKRAPSKRKNAKKTASSTPKRKVSARRTAAKKTSPKKKSSSTTKGKR
jgi:hypothetical protein